jgi:hypothetical protein
MPGSVTCAAPVTVLPLRLRLMSVGGRVVLGDESAVESNLNVKRREPYQADAGNPFGNAIPKARSPSETDAFPNSPAWLTCWRILVEQDSPIESSFLRISQGATSLLAVQARRSR